MTTLKAYFDTSLELLIDATKHLKLVVSCEKADQNFYWVILPPLFPDYRQEGGHFIHNSDIKAFLCGLLIGDRLGCKKSMEAK